MKTLACLAALVFLAFPSGLFAQDQIISLKNEIIDLQNKGQLGFSEFTLCSKILGFGSYVPLDSPSVKQGSKLLIYYQPVNVFTSRARGQYEIWYAQDIIILSSDGEKLFEQAGILDFHYLSRTPVFDLYANNSISLGDAPPGRYVYKAILHDKLNDAVAEHVLPFEIAP